MLGVLIDVYEGCDHLPDTVAILTALLRALSHVSGNH
jgi:hypothetical protein